MTSHLANPFSTGGGGTTFEHLVGMYYLVSLLASDIPRGLNRGTCYRVGFQHRWSNNVFDDIVVTAQSSDASEYRLMLQVKHEITISTAETNNLFRRVISDCWEAFEGQRGDYNPNNDRLGIATGVYNAVVDKHLQSLLLWARTSSSAEEFDRIRVPVFASSEMRRYYDDFEIALSEAAARQVPREEIWRFLRCFVYIHFDLEHDVGRDFTYLRNRALDQLTTQDAGEVNKLLDSLQVLVSSHDKTGGAIDIRMLRNQLNQHPLKDLVSCARDLERLRNHSERTLSRINETIGQCLHLPRITLVTEAIETVKNSQVVFILGELGVGKSVLLKKIVDQLRQEGEVLVTTIDNISGTTIEQFISNLQIDHDIQTLLGAFAAAPFRCLFIDQLEKTLFDPDRSRVLYDLIHEIHKYNNQLGANSKEAQWRIVATCRADQYYPVLSALQQVIDLSTLKTIEVPPLEESDVDAVVEMFPSFQHLSEQQHIQSLLRNPFILDFLTFPELNLVDLPKPEVLTESWLGELYWSQIIRNFEGAGRGRGNPDIREQAVVSLGEIRLRNGRKQIPSSELNPEIIGHLIQDRVIHSADGRISFIHDTLDDWTVSRILLSHWDQLPALLREYGETLQLIKPIRLLALRQLELRQAVEQWSELLNILKNDSTLAARWYQTVLVAPLASPMFSNILTAIKPLMFTGEGTLLEDFIRALRTIYTVPSQSIFTLFRETNPSPVEFEKMLAWFREPVAENWIPVWELLFKHQDTLPVQALPEIAEAALLWMKNESVPLRREVGLFCLTILDKDFQNRLRDGYYDDEFVSYSLRDNWIDDKVVQRLRKSVLNSADCIPQEVKTLLYTLLEKDERNLVELLFGRDAELNWTPIAKHMPEVFVDITLDLFCDKREIEISEYDDIISRRLFRESGIKHDHIWRFPTRYKEDTPFFYFLNMNPNYGLKLIIDLVNFATQKWVERTRQAGKVNPLPQMLLLPSGNREYWGNREVYNWILEVPPHTVALALLALRFWLDEYFKTREQEDPSRVFDFILSQSNSVAIVAVCVLVALDEMNERASALMPILEQPAFWQLDQHREHHMMIFGNDQSFHTFYQFSQIILFTGNQVDRERLQSGLKRFPTNIPFFFEEEKHDKDLVKNLTEHMEELAALADSTNYSLKPHEDGIVIEFTYPEEIELRRKGALQAIEIFQTQMKLQAWAHSVASGNHPENLSIEQAIQLAKRFDTSLESHDKRTFEIVAETCSAVLLHHYTWLKENGHLEWCRKILFEAVYHKDTNSEVPDPITGLLHIVPRALPALVINDPTDNDARQAIWDLIATSNPHPVDTAVKDVFEAIIPLWQIDPDYVWQCYNLLVAKAEMILSNRRKRNRQENEEIGAITFVELKTEVPKLIQLDVDYVYLLHPLVVGLPILPDFSSKDSDDARILDFLDELVAFNNKANKYSQMTAESRQHRLFQVPREWEKPLYEHLANWVLHLQFDMACEHILDPIINVWEEGAGALENLLDTLLENAQSSTHKERFVQIWKHTIPRVMQTETVHQNLQTQRRTEFKHTYSCLLLMTRYGFSEVWEERDWNPSLNLVTEFELWVEKLGHYYDNFSTLVRMLRSVGKPITIPYGIDWLFTVFQHTEEPDRLFASTRDLSALSQLLLDIWFEHGNLPSGDQSLFQKFTFLVDYLVSKGDQVAVELQRKIQL